MNKILIINFGSESDIIDSAHLIAELKRKNKDSEISLLTFYNNKKLSHQLKSIHRVYSVEKEKINELTNNPIYSNGFAIETFTRNLRVVNQQKWDLIVSYSLDNFSQYIASTLDSTKFIGAYINEHNNSIHTSFWTNLSRNIFTDMGIDLLNHRDCMINACGLRAQEDSVKLNTNEKNNQLAFQNINQLRDQEITSGSGKVIGIRILSEEDPNGFSLDIYNDIVSSLLDTPSLIPLLIVSSSNKEKTMANEINNSFDNTLTSVEMDLNVTGSLLLNIDLLISPESSTKHLASLVETPSIGLYKTRASLFENFSHSLGDFSLIIDQDNFNPSTIVDSVYSLTNNEELNLVQDDATSIFITERDEIGSKLTVIKDGGLTKNQITYLTSRVYLASLKGKLDSTTLLKSIHQEFSNEIPAWIQFEREQLLETTKILLGTLRHLMASSGNKSEGVAFIKSLNKLLQFKDIDSLSTIPIHMFFHNLDKLSEEDQKTNLEITEKQLYLLKANLQKAMTCLSLLGNMHRITSEENNTNSDSENPTLEV